MSSGEKPKEADPVRKDPAPDAAAQPGEQPDAAAPQQAAEGEQPPPAKPRTFTILVRAPNNLAVIRMATMEHDQVSDVRSYLFECRQLNSITNYVLKFQGLILPDTIYLGEIYGLKEDGDNLLEMVDLPYEMESARFHTNHLRSMLSAETHWNRAALPSVTLVEAPPDPVAHEVVGGQAMLALAEKRAEENKRSGAGDDNKQVAKKQNKNKKKKTKRKAKAKANTPGVIDSNVVVDFEATHSCPLTSILPPPEEEIEAIRDLSLSSFNPPPRERALEGDLFYLVAETLEGETVHITACAAGFYVNRTTGDEFDPTPAEPFTHSHYLFLLLSQVSGEFAAGYERILDNSYSKQAIEVYGALPHKTFHPWLKHSQLHHRNGLRAEAFLSVRTSATDSSLPHQQRDWNDEYQALRLPSGPEEVMDRILRYRQLDMLHAEFLAEAKLGIREIVSHSIPALNPEFPPDSHVFLFKNIFFSSAYDTRGSEDFGGEHGAEIIYKASSADLNGVRLLNTLPGGDQLRTVLQCLITFQGHRYMAQALIPGILSHTQKLKYGSIDESKKIEFDEEFHALFSKFAENTTMVETTQVDGSGNAVKTVAPHQAKGLLGTDGRKYCLDIHCVTCRDLNYPNQEGIHSGAVIRSELVDYAHRLRYSYKESREQTKKQMEAAEQELKRQIAEEAEKKASADAEGGADDGGGDGEGEAQEEKKRSPQEILDALKAHVAAEEKEREVGREKNPLLRAFYDMIDMEWKLNQKIGFKNVRLGDDVDVEKETKNLQIMADFLRAFVIPTFVSDLVQGQVQLTDSEQLCMAMHLRGINLRYLGAIANKFSGHRLQRLFVTEIVSRCAKHVLNKTLRDAESWQARDVIANFLNAYLGESTGKKSKKQAAKDPLHKAYVQLAAVGAEARAAATIERVESTKAVMEAQRAEEAGEGNEELRKVMEAALAAAAAAAQAAAAAPERRAVTWSHASLWKELDAQAQMRFDFSLTKDAPDFKLEKVPALRVLCRQVGIQLRARDFFAGAQPFFSRDDVAGMFELTKDLRVTNPDVLFLIEEAKAQSANGNVKATQEYLEDAMHIVQSTYGPMHVQFGNALNYTATALYQTGDLAAAFTILQRAVIVFERVCGLDRPDVAQCYTTLGLFASQLGQDSQALAYYQRAIAITRLTCGDNSLANVDNYASIGQLLEKKGQHALALPYFTEALRIAENTITQKNIGLAALYHCAAEAHAAVDDFKSALQCERRNYMILSSFLGDAHPRTKESNIWLKQYTGKAVQMQIDIKRAEQQVDAEEAARAAANRELGNLPVPDLVRYITGSAPKPQPATEAAPTGAATSSAGAASAVPMSGVQRGGLRRTGAGRFR